jgi:hypothetical protein
LKLKASAIFREPELQKFPKEYQAAIDAIIAREMQGMNLI